MSCDIFIKIIKVHQYKLIEEYITKDIALSFTVQIIILLQVTMESQNLSTAKNVLDRLVSFLKPDTSTKIKSSIVALYSAQPQFQGMQQQSCKLHFSGQIVLLHLDYDRKLKNYFLRLYHLQKLSMLLEVELYYGFDQYFVCHFDNPCLYYFQYLEKGLFALLFKDLEESKQFAAKVNEVSPKQYTLQAVRQKFKDQQIKQKQKNSFFGLIAGLFQKETKSKQQSSIVQIKKQRTVSFDYQGEIVTENVSPEWKQIIVNSGLKQADKQKSTIKSKILNKHQNASNPKDLK